MTSEGFAGMSLDVIVELAYIDAVVLYNIVQYKLF